jgi:P-type Cu2+ transporter
MVERAQEMRRPASCLHCGSPVPEGSALGGFCCAGCEAVHGLLVEQGLTRYYALAGTQTAPAVEPRPERTLAWLEPLLARAEAGSSPVCSLELDVQGIHCAACVWLMNELFRRDPKGAQITVNPALGKVSLAWRRGFDVGGYLRKVEGFGYLFGPSRKSPGASSADLPLRLGICTAITMNVMIFSVSFYMGLAPADGALFELFTRLSVWLSAVVVGVGGWPFFKSAVQGVRRGMLHLDLPIALGIALVFVTSVERAGTGRGDLAYFDTLNVFVTLMLVGRWLQQRVLERNRRFLLEDDGADALLVRKVEGDGVRTLPAPKVVADDVLMVAPGELLPVDGTVLDEARICTEWITGEPDHTTLPSGATAAAGAFNVGGRAFRLRASTDFAASPLGALLRTSRPDARGGGSRFWSLLSRVWVAGVLGVAAVGLCVWWPHDPQMALDVAAALLVVTCPCALGIASPLAYELVQSRMRRAGFFVRSQALLDRLPQVRKILFDKTGTLTLGRLELAEPAQVLALSPRARDAAYDMAARSNHPVSRALAFALARAGASFCPDRQVEELFGRGLELRLDGELWRLGAPGWAAKEEGGGGPSVVLGRDGEVVARIFLRESVRPDARREAQTLMGTGHEVWIVSGDRAGRVGAMADALGIPAARALWGRSPEQKAQDVSRIDGGRADTLYLGDGVNDSLAFERAACAGTPAIDRPVMPGKADFFLMGEGLASIRKGLELARMLRSVVRRLLVRAAVYNVLVVSASLLGFMTPLRAALVMPASSIALILYTLWSLREGQGPAAPEIACNDPVPGEVCA